MLQQQNMVVIIFMLILFIIMGMIQFDHYQRDEAHLFKIYELIKARLSSSASAELSIQPESEKTNLPVTILKILEDKKLNKNENSFASKAENLMKDRLGVICYISPGENQVYHFLPLLYGSWKYITSNSNELLSTEQQSSMLHIDLLAFCHPEACPHIQQECQDYNKYKVNSPNTPTCWAIEQPFESSVSYGPINSFIMFNRTDISSILKPYKFVMRTDYDVFLTPATLLWRPNKEIIVGRGGYCDPFNMKRLKKIAKSLGLTHRSIHCVGSTWVGKTEKFIVIAKKALELTGYVYENEFDPKLPGLEVIDFAKNREGEWIRWWRPVSLLYGCELAMNHLVQDFSEEYKGPLDGSSCDVTKTVWEVPHVHCWHSDCEFHKFSFIDHIRQAIHGTGTLDAKIVHKIIENTYEKDVSNMTLRDYSIYTAWHSVGKHLRTWFLA